MIRGIRGIQHPRWKTKKITKMGPWPFFSPGANQSPLSKQSEDLLLRVQGGSAARFKNLGAFHLKRHLNNGSA
jgi:hypothetical protein